MTKCWLKVDKETKLGELPTDATPGLSGGEEAARAQTDALRDELIDLQQRLWAGRRGRLLVLLQAMDTGGKDGLIRKVFSGVNPAGVKVSRFEQPTPIELAHDYLWRVHPHVPADGEIAIFNRSQYEDVLAVRVNDLVPKAVWKRRYRHLRDFEKMLSDEGTTIVKLFLHIGYDEQRERLQARLDRPDKQWKFDPHDLEQRKHWNDYMRAYRDAIVETDCDDARWYVIPADHKWFRDWAAMRILVDTLKRMKPEYPEPQFNPAAFKVV